jgi:sugar phosphate permease
LLAGSASLTWVVIAALGFAIYGPQMLIGLCGAELVSQKSVGASQGILGLISYMGAAGAGIPLSYVQVSGLSWLVGGGGGGRAGFAARWGCRPDAPTASSPHPPWLLCHSLLQVHWGWNGYFATMIGACVISLLLLAPLANAKSFVQLKT